MNIVHQSATYLPAPAPMSRDKDHALLVALSHLEPHGLGFRVMSPNAPSDLRREHFDDRRRDLRARLVPAGRLYAARRIGEMNNATRPRDKGATQRERDAEFEKMVSGVMDLPAFAIHEAAEDFEKGTHGEGWMPRLAEFRPHALGKCQAWRAQLVQIERVLSAEVVVVQSDPARKQALLDMARRVTREMPTVGRGAEAERAGKVVEAPKPEETPEAALVRLKAEADQPIAPLSASARKAAEVMAEMKGAR